MSEREEFQAWLKTWALPGNTSREDAMYAAWQACAARTGADAIQAEVDRLRLGVETLTESLDDSRQTGMTILKELNELKAARTAPAEQAEPVAEMKGCYLYPLKSIPSGTKLYTAPDALQAEVERLREEKDSYQRVGIKAMEELEALKAAAKRLIEAEDRLTLEDTIYTTINLAKERDEAAAELRALVARTAKPEVDHE